MVINYNRMRKGVTCGMVYTKWLGEIMEYHGGWTTTNT